MSSFERGLNGDAGGRERGSRLRVSGDLNGMDVRWDGECDG